MYEILSIRIKSNHYRNGRRSSNIKLALVTNTQHPRHFAILDKNINTSQKNVVKHRDNSISKYIKDLDGNFLELIKYED